MCQSIWFLVCFLKKKLQAFTVMPTCIEDQQKTWTTWRAHYPLSFMFRPKRKNGFHRRQFFMGVATCLHSGATNRSNLYLQVKWIEEQNQIFSFVILQFDIFKVTIHNCGALESRGCMLNFDLLKLRSYNTKI